MLSPSNKKKLIITIDVAFHEHEMYFTNPKSSLLGENQIKVQTLDYTISNSGDHSQENNEVNDMELSGNVLETSVDHSHENVVESRLAKDELTPPDNSLPSSPPDNPVPQAISQSVSPLLSPNDHN
ncbi:hypothetical protein FF2_034452 [Malus domestica]